MAAAQYDKYRRMLKEMEEGHSFFVEGKTPKDLYFLRQVARRANIKISIRKVEDDEIYQGKNGTRVWKEKSDENDSL